MKSSATLVVCPASLVHQWASEIDRRCERGLLKVIMYHGPNREKDLKKFVLQICVKVLVLNQKKIILYTGLISRHNKLTVNCHLFTFCSVLKNASG